MKKEVIDRKDSEQESREALRKTGILRDAGDAFKTEISNSIGKGTNAILDVFIKGKAAGLDVAYMGSDFFNGIWDGIQREGALNQEDEAILKVKLQDLFGMNLDSSSDSSSEEYESQYKKDIIAEGDRLREYEQEQKNLPINIGQNEEESTGSRFGELLKTGGTNVLDAVGELLIPSLNAGEMEAIASNEFYNTPEGGGAKNNEILSELDNLLAANNNKNNTTSNESLDGSGPLGVPGTTFADDVTFKTKVNEMKNKTLEVLDDVTEGIITEVPVIKDEVIKKMAN